MKSPALALAAALLAALAALPARANDFPTVDRVLYVQECMSAHPGPKFEMVNKCSCALDAIARDVKFEDYVEMVTVVKAMSIGGERGSNIRDAEPLKVYLKRHRELQAKVEQGCFLSAANPTGPR
ncbi:hypothetical protein [Rubrivivax sp. A210]|uniref:hypothetical protein n=1 Tax=Rubrivivax sp. A210 TaxID=2772301 RepID=UPI0019195ECB|nr:hypothetical protein [Rubrivivax sp. A210]